MYPEVRPATEEEIEADWREFTGGLPVVGLLREYAHSDVEGIVWRDSEAGRTGVVTWWVDGERAEIVSVHAEPQGSGTGTRIMDAAEEELRKRGVKTAVLATTNDNTRALNFYIKRGYRLVRLHLDAMDRVRALKPGVPRTGRDGVPLQDMWELEKPL
ncbi:MAG TPA: GNAT family N-acetyltransferase [Dehalococcoidia bacterium]|jgi:ribosomal protein S18 acetylase RimI-like enzyme|nr:GNAT family N-acetyltransferase [Dehalococcoidia bacterium]